MTFITKINLLFQQKKYLAVDPLQKTKIFFNWSVFFVWLLAADHEASVRSFTSYISSLPGSILPCILLILTIHSASSNTCHSIDENTVLTQINRQTIISLV